MVVLGWWLGLMILEVFSNLKDSMILRFYDSMNSPVQCIRKKFTTVMVDHRMLWRPLWLLNQHRCIRCTIKWLHSTLHYSHFLCFYNIHHCPVLLTSLQSGNVFVLWQRFYNHLIYDWHKSVWRATTNTIINALHSHVTVYSTWGWSLKSIYHLEKKKFLVNRWVLDVVKCGLGQAFTTKLRLFYVTEMSERTGICVLNPWH